MVDYAFMKDCVCAKALADAHAGGTSRPVQSSAIQVSLIIIIYSTTVSLLLYSHDIYLILIAQNQYSGGQR